MGHQVQVTYSGPAAIQQAIACQPRLLLLDIGMPGMDGHEVAERLLEQSETRDVILVAMTGYGQESDKVRARKAGFDHHLVKPVDPIQLQSLLSHLVEPEEQP